MSEWFYANEFHTTSFLIVYLPVERKGESCRIGHVAVVVSNHPAPLLQHDPVSSILFDGVNTFVKVTERVYVLEHHIDKILPVL